MMEGCADENELCALDAIECMVMYNLACLEAMNGNTEEAFTWLSGSVDAGYGDPDWMPEGYCCNMPGYMGIPHRYGSLLDIISHI